MMRNKNNKTEQQKQEDEAARVRKLIMEDKSLEEPWLYEKGENVVGTEDSQRNNSITENKAEITKNTDNSDERFTKLMEKHILVVDSVQEGRRVLGLFPRKLPFQEVYEWSCRLQGELEASDWKIEYGKVKAHHIRYYWTPELKNLLNRLIFTKGNLILVVGPQGCGKTITRKVFAAELKEISDTHKLGFDIYTAKWGTFSELGYWDEFDYRDADSGRWRREREWYWRDEYTHYLIDLPDFSKTSKAAINKFLDKIQDFWTHCCHRDMKKNIVIFLQEEALKYCGHYFLGKAEIFRLRRLKPQELVDMYKNIFEKIEIGKNGKPIIGENGEPVIKRSTEPFTEEALLYIAKLSRGIPRRFKKYIAQCMEKWYFEDGMKSPKITLQHVSKWISQETILQDLEKEVYDLFPKSKQMRENAVILLRFLMEHGEAEQQELAKLLGEGKAAEMQASRILEKLEQHGLIKRWTKGKKKIVCLTE